MPVSPSTKSIGASKVMDTYRPRASVNASEDALRVFDRHLKHGDRMLVLGFVLEDFAFALRSDPLSTMRYMARRMVDDSFGIQYVGIDIGLLKQCRDALAISNPDLSHRLTEAIDAAGRP